MNPCGVQRRRPANDMKLLSLKGPELLDLAAGWLSLPENDQWLDFGNGRQVVTPLLLKMMSQHDLHYLRLFTGEDDQMPIGIVGVHSINRAFGTGTLWWSTGEKPFRNRGYTTYAVSRFLTEVFLDLNLHVVNSWAVDHHPSVRVFEQLNFRFIGRQRLCHCIHGRLYDRLLFDLLAREHVELELPESSRARTARSEMHAVS